MQVAPGLLDERVMREGLDWLVWQARRFSLRLVLVLTSARWPVARRRGGAAQYVRWQSPDPAGGTLHDFLTNDTFKVRAALAEAGASGRGACGPAGSTSSAAETTTSAVG